MADPRKSLLAPTSNYPLRPPSVEFPYPRDASKQSKFERNALLLYTIHRSRFWIRIFAEFSPLRFIIIFFLISNIFPVD